MPSPLAQFLGKHVNAVAAVLALAAAFYDWEQQTEWLNQLTLEIETQPPSEMLTIHPARGELWLKALDGSSARIRASDWTGLSPKPRSRLRFDLPIGKYFDVWFVPDPSLAEVTIFQVRLLAHAQDVVIEIPLDRTDRSENLETGSRTEEAVTFHRIRKDMLAAVDLRVAESIEKIPASGSSTLPEVIFVFIGAFLAGYGGLNMVLRHFCLTKSDARDESWRGPALRLGIILGLVACMAAVAPLNSYPDEYLHVESARYYIHHWLPPSLKSKWVVPSFSHYGNTYLTTLDMGYLFAGKFALVAASLFPDSFTALRFFNVLLLILTLSWMVRVFRGSPATWIFLITPQLWYVFAGWNTEGWALFVSLLLIGQIVQPGSSLQQYLAFPAWPKALPLIVPSLVLSCALIMAKKNFLLVLLFFDVWLAWRLVFEYSELKILRRIVRILPLFLIPLMLRFSLLIYFNHVNGNDLRHTIREQAEKYAEPEFKPSALSAGTISAETRFRHLKERGVPLTDILFRHGWLSGTSASFVGIYGWLEFNSARWFYILMAIGWAAILACAAVATLVWSSRSERVINILAWLHLPLIAGLAIRFAWTEDFQAQGRYLFPFLPILFYLLANRFTPRRFLSPIVWCLFLASVYGFVFFGLSPLVQKADFTSVLTP